MERLFDKASKSEQGHAVLADGKSDLGIGKSDPGFNKSDPGTGAGNPGTGAGNPGTGAGNPGTSVGNPGSGVGNPGIGVGNPGSGVGNPGTGAGNPGTGAGNPGTGVGRLADASFKSADASFKSADAEFKPADAKFKSADARFKSADARFRQIEIGGRERPEGQGEAGRLLPHFTAPCLDTTLLLPRIHLMPTPLQTILESYRASSQTEREKGSYFEELIRTYLRFEASYADRYSEVWLFADWVKEIGGPQFGFNAKDTGIDLVAKTHGTGTSTTRLWPVRKV